MTPDDLNRPTGYKLTYQDLRFHVQGLIKPKCVSQTYKTAEEARKALVELRTVLSIGHPPEMKALILGCITPIHSSAGRRSAMRTRKFQAALEHLPKMEKRLTK